MISSPANSASLDGEDLHACVRKLEMSSVEVMVCAHLLDAFVMAKALLSK